MRQPLDLSQKALDDLGAQADRLDEWLEGQDVAAHGTHGLPLPPRLTAIASLALVYSLPILLDSGLPASTCWSAIGGCMM